MFEKMAQNIISHGGKIVMNCECAKITTIGNKVCSVTDKEGNIYECDYLVSSIPVCELVNMFDLTDNNVINVANKLPYRDFITVAVIASELNVKNTTQYNTYNGLLPDCWIYVQDRKYNIGRIQIYNNWSPYMVKNKNEVLLACEIFCSDTDDIWSMKDSEICNMAIKELCQMGVVSSNIVKETFLYRQKKRLYVQSA